MALPGDKCSPKKVKLGLQQPLTVPSGLKESGRPILSASHPANIPFASIPKVPGKEGGLEGVLPESGSFRLALAKEPCCLDMCHVLGRRISCIML